MENDALVYKTAETQVCANDYMAISVCEELCDRGFRVPEDIIVTGFDDVEEGSLFGTFHISNDDVWEKIMDGSYGISMECIFSRFSEQIAPSTEINPEEQLEEKVIDNIEKALNKLLKR